MMAAASSPGQAPREAVAPPIIWWHGSERYLEGVTVIGGSMGFCAQFQTAEVDRMPVLYIRSASFRGTASLAA
jgi:hypothetical protein